MLLKAAMLIGAVALTGAGLGRFWLLEPGPAGGGGDGGLGASAGAFRRRAQVGLVLGGLAVVVLASLADLRGALLNVIPTADAALLWRYALTSGHGEAVQLRVVLASCLAALALSPSAGRRSGAAFLVGSLGLYGSFSVISHGAVMGGWLPLVTDLVHFAAAGLWAGAVFVTALLPRWDDSSRTVLVGAVRKLSLVGLLAVLALAATGTISALVHAGDPARFLGSAYATILLVKLALVAVTVALAAANRFLFLPSLLAGGGLTPLCRALHLETVLLLAVLVATGWLTTTAVPHGSGVSVEPLENARRLLEHLGR